MYFKVNWAWDEDDSASSLIAFTLFAQALDSGKEVQDHISSNPAALREVPSEFHSQLCAICTIPSGFMNPHSTKH